MNKTNNLNALDILKYIMRHKTIDRKTYKIFITGRIGPTGKTWLCNELCKAGYDAMELTPGGMSQLLKDDGTNHIIVDDIEKHVIVVMNEILPMYERKLSKSYEFDPKEVCTFRTWRAADDVLREMVYIADEYGVVTRADFKDLLARPTDSDDCKYGWLPDTIRKAIVVRLANGYFIEFPKAFPID